MGKQIKDGEFRKTDTICFYWSLGPEEKSRVKKALAKIAQELGHTSIQKPGSGRFASVLEAIANGELVVIPTEEYNNLNAKPARKKAEAVA